MLLLLKTIVIIIISIFLYINQSFFSKVTLDLWKTWYVVLNFLCNYRFRVLLWLLNSDRTYISCCYSPMTRMLLSCSTPSILDRSWLTTVSCTPVLLAPVPRCLQIASSSSKMMICRPLLAPNCTEKHRIIIKTEKIV